MLHPRISAPPHIHRAHVIGYVVAVFGLLLLSFGLHRLARRESLRIDLDRRRLLYCTRLWPGIPREEFEVSFDDVKEVRLESKLEAPGGGRGQMSTSYEVLRARLLVRPRRAVELDRTTEHERVRALAEAVARAVKTEIRE